MEVSLMIFASLHATRLPFLAKKSLEYLPAIMSLRGTLPSSSMISAIWSMWLQGEGGTNGTNNRSVRQSPSQGPALGVWVEVRLTARPPSLGGN